MTLRVTAPVEGFTGSVAGVDFVDGVAETDSPAAIAYFRRKGYALADAKPAKAPAKKAAVKPSEK
ncbi:MAG TPA: hypothetical protein VJL80_09710 [Aeromicrobium sp.]|nr:hypothetical protein [Aeromicrobium sp.]HKY58301.1 hypothetical protein [Aeromicrobium sp.]